MIYSVNNITDYEIKKICKYEHHRYYRLQNIIDSADFYLSICFDLNVIVFFTINYLSYFFKISSTSDFISFDAIEFISASSTVRPVAADSA